jgi:hypothetical protein
MVRRAAEAVLPGGIIAFLGPALQVSGHTFRALDPIAVSERSEAVRALAPLCAHAYPKRDADRMEHGLGRTQPKRSGVQYLDLLRAAMSVRD